MATWDDNNPLLRETFHKDTFEDLQALARTTRRSLKDLTKDAIEAFRVDLTTVRKKPGRAAS
jgi:hypothetical protein